MAEGFEQFHVPQQSRRDKLRVVVHNHNNTHHHPNCEDFFTNFHGLLPLYDPSLLPHDMLTTLANPLPGLKQQNQICVKEEGGAQNLMSYVSGFMKTTAASTSSPHHHHHHHHQQQQQHQHHPYLHPSNPSSIQDISNSPFLLTAQNYRELDQSFNGGGGQALSLTNDSRTTTTGQGLSLSLSSHHTHEQSQQQHNLPLELNLPSLGMTGYGGVRGIIDGGGCTSTSNDIRSSVPLGPFTGYASILKGSRFLKPAKQLLEEFCDVGRGFYVDRSGGDSSSLMDASMDSLSVGGVVDDSASTSDRSNEHRRKKSRLISMLDEVFRRYKLYCQQTQAIVASFESVAGLGNAAPYTSFALKAMSKHFSSLKNAITDQLRCTNKALDDGNQCEDRFGTADRWVHVQRPAHNLGCFEPHHQPVWRPQRGLPERAVSVLRAWLFEHFLHPYPTDTDKQMLAKQTGLSRSQVSNWFINARVRLWKPMVEEIHMLETRQTQNATGVDDLNSCKPDDRLPISNPPKSDKQPETSCTLNLPDQTSKRSRVEHLHVPENVNGANEASKPTDFMYNTFPSHHHVGVGVSTSAGNSGVSLTLGLRQNNGIGLSESFPMNIAHQFGLEASNEGYVIGHFEAPNRHFAKDIGGQLFHDFVG